MRGFESGVWAPGVGGPLTEVKERRAGATEQDVEWYLLEGKDDSTWQWVLAT